MEEVTWARSPDWFFHTFEDYGLVTLKMTRITKIAVSDLTVKGEILFNDTSSPSTASMGGKTQCHLVAEDNADNAWSYFLKEKSELKDVLMSLLKDLNTMYGIDARHICVKM